MCGSPYVHFSAFGFDVTRLRGLRLELRGLTGAEVGFYFLCYGIENDGVGRGEDEGVCSFIKSNKGCMYTLIETWYLLLSMTVTVALDAYFMSLWDFWPRGRGVAVVEWPAF